MAKSVNYTDQIGDTDDLGDALGVLREACRDLAGAVGVARMSGYLTPEARAGILELIARLHAELDRDLDDRWRDDEREDPYRPGEWNTVPLTGMVCPGCHREFTPHPESAGIFECGCANHIWRKEPGGWQVLFVDEADEAGGPA